MPIHARPLLYGAGPAGTDPEQDAEALSANPTAPLHQRLEAFEDVMDRRIGDSLFTRARNLERVHGVIHLGGRTSISRYDVGRLMERLMGVEPSILKGVCLNDINLPAPRARNISLDSARAYGLGYDPTDLEEAMRRALVLWGVLEAESL